MTPPFLPLALEGGFSVCGTSVMMTGGGQSFDEAVFRRIKGRRERAAGRREGEKWKYFSAVMDDV
jgi:hypothetical protein